MSITVATIQTDLNTYIGDSSTDRISAIERLSAITEATIWAAEQLTNDHQVSSYELGFLDTVNYYQITTAIADLLAPNDLRIKDTKDNQLPFTRKSPTELALEVGIEDTDWSYAIEERDAQTYLVVNYDTKHKATTIALLDNITEDGEWTVDATNSDATNVTTDSNEFKRGSGSVNFDIDVSQSGNNLGTLINSTLSSKDLGDFEDLGTHIIWAYIPDVTNFTSITLYWGTDSSNYWSVTATTDYLGNAWVDGWNRVSVAWSDSTKTSSPDAADIAWLRTDFNYGAGQGDDTDFRIDDWVITRAETLRFYYLSWNVGTNSGGTDLTAFSATDDIPYFSGKYDQYRYPIAHKAASILLLGMGLPLQSQAEAIEAERELRIKSKLFPKSLRQEMKNFKAKGVSWNRRLRKRIIR